MMNNPSADMSDPGLAMYVTALRLTMPNVGVAMVMGSLRSHGYPICRARVRQAVHLQLHWPGLLTR